MSKKIVCALLMSLSITTYAQIGIGTNSPTEMFDVNGIQRIRQLPQSGDSNAIYTKPAGTKSSSKDQSFNAVKTIVADSNGVIGTVNWIPSQNPTSLAGTDGLDAVATSQTAKSRTGTTGSTPVLASKTFTLTKKSMVTLSFNLSVSSIQDYNQSNLTDGTSKRYGARLLLNNAMIINSGNPFTNAGSQYTSGFFYLNGSRALILNAGTYTVDLIGSVYAFTPDTIGISATFGATTDDQLDIIAIPLQ